MSSPQVKHPIILWAQREDTILLTVEVMDMNVEVLNYEDSTKTFTIKGSTKTGDKYEAALKLYEELEWSDRNRIKTDRHVELIINKKKPSWWPRLLESKDKVQWIKVDFNKWIDEDDEEEAAGAGFDSSAFQNFDFSKFGGAGGEDEDVDASELAAELDEHGVSDDEAEEELSKAQDSAEDVKTTESKA
ncbi:unnamed protein product [Bursaphelenchus xylophilus]|uniref:(pine wood nematode) hypothetical protein n=1 Tax=Bursaphelenchus xylophilus TaxID=6326 RepID=A0A1I7RPB4_BURXY|nr:unnamed protein product [Bursaphelenchus xylophilus]CAG9095732.1 unnamed protein product [Bursaphelenchus xylophilus]